MLSIEPNNYNQNSIKKVADLINTANLQLNKNDMFAVVLVMLVSYGSSRPSRVFPVLTERHRTPPWLNPSGWASLRYSPSRPAERPAAEDASDRSWFVALYLQSQRERERERNVKLPFAPLPWVLLSWRLQNLGRVMNTFYLIAFGETSCSLLSVFSLSTMYLKDFKWELFTRVL